MGCSDTGLHEGSSLTRGCGSMGIIWNSSLPVNNVSIDSDRIVAVQLNVSSSSTLNIVGVYLPTADNPLDVYKQYLQELENVVYALQTSGPVLILGDFNVHIGQAHSNRAQCQTNSQGHLLMDMIDRTGHYAVSLSDLATGPTHTFFGGGRNTTVDFCFIDCWAAHLVFECEVQQRHPLNLSDHLALNVKLDCKPQVMVHHEDTNRKLNWTKAASNGSIVNFQNMVSSSLTPFLEHPLVSITEVDKEIASVVTLLHQAAAATIPISRCKSRVKHFIHDEELKQKCQASKSAWKTWRDANRPRSGPLYQQMKTTKYEVKSHVRKCRAKQERKTIQTVMTCSEARTSDVSTYNDEIPCVESSW